MARPRIGVIDHGSGNLHSACRALEAAGGAVTLAAPAELGEVDALVLPGVGAFAACMAGVQAVGADDLVRTWVADDRPLLGICVGHQVLFDSGIEHGITAPGLGLLPGVVERLTSPRLPHMGWNTVTAAEGSRVLAGLEDERFYFVHSYGVRHFDDSASWSAHDGDRFVAVVEQASITSTQFHPEKSGRAGARLLRNWLASL